MSAKHKGMLVTAAIAMAVVYASNNELPIVGDRFKRLMSGGTGWL